MIDFGNSKTSEIWKSLATQNLTEANSTELNSTEATQQITRRHATRTSRGDSRLSDRIQASCGCFDTSLLMHPRTCRSWSCCTAAADGRGLQSRSGLVYARRSLRFCAAVARAAALQQSERLLQLVSARRIATRLRRGLSIGQMVERWCATAASIRTALRHRAFGGRRDDVRHAGLLPGCVRRRRDHCRPAVWRRLQCAAGVREHVSVPVPQWAALGGPGARRGPSYAGQSDNRRWPRVSIWHGNADKTVIPRNAGEMIKQWTNVHGLALQPSLQDTVDGYPRQVWINDAGEEVIESYSITHMAHGTPLATARPKSVAAKPALFCLKRASAPRFTSRIFRPDR